MFVSREMLHDAVASDATGVGFDVLIVILPKNDWMVRGGVKSLVRSRELMAVTASCLLRCTTALPPAARACCSIAWPYAVLIAAGMVAATVPFEAVWRVESIATTCSTIW
jgi:hypothetical protein